MLYKCIMANTSAIWQQTAHTTYQLLSLSCSIRTRQKSLTLIEKCSRDFSKKVRRMDHKQKNNKTKKQGRKTSVEIGKGNQMTALRYQTGENIRHCQPPFWVKDVRQKWHPKTISQLSSVRQRWQATDHITVVLSQTKVTSHRPYHSCPQSDKGDKPQTISQLSSVRQRWQATDHKHYHSCPQSKVTSHRPYHSCPQSDKGDKPQTIKIITVVLSQRWQATDHITVVLSHTHTLLTKVQSAQDTDDNQKIPSHLSLTCMVWMVGEGRQRRGPKKKRWQTNRKGLSWYQ